MIKRGRYIVWEGSDGIGKSTQQQIAVQESKARGIPTLATREPGGSSIGLQVREILLSPDTGDLHPTTELHLFLADRVQLWFGKLAGALADGYDVHSDRSWWSTLAYQGAGGELGFEEVIQAHRLSLPDAYLNPDLGFIFYMTEQERQERHERSGFKEFGTKDRIEQQGDDYFGRLLEGYDYAMRELGAIGISAAGSIEDVSARWWPYVFPE